VSCLESSSRCCDSNGGEIPKLPIGRVEDKYYVFSDSDKRWVTKGLGLLGLFWLVGSIEFRQASSDIHNFVGQIMGCNLLSHWNGNEHSGGYASFNTMVEGTSGWAMLRGRIVNLLIAGRDTRARLISWAL
jgi:hypothetical protein